MSEDALNASIASKWEAAGLNGGNDDLELDTTPEPDVAEVVDTDTDTTTATVDDTTVDTTVADTTGVDDTTTAAAATKSADDLAAEKTAAEQVQQDTEDELAAALGLGKPPEDPIKRKQWWKSRLPYSQVHKIVTEREKKLAEAHSGALKTHTDKISEYDTRFADVKKVEDLITNDAEQYVKTLATLFPDTYGKMFAPLLGDGTGETAVLPDMEDPGPKPEANLKLADGSMTYDVEGYERLMDWQQKVTEQKMLGRFKPHLDFLKTQQQEADKKAKEAAIAERNERGIKTAREAIAEAETWEGAKANMPAILAEAKKLGPEIDAVTALNIAYRIVMIPKLKADRDAMQAEIVKGMKDTSTKQTAAGLQTQSRTGAATTPEAATGDLDSRIKAAWKRSGLI